MYESHFGLREAPFNNTPNPRFFFSTPEHEEAFAGLLYVVRESRGFAVLTGDAGTGKTLVSRLLISRLGSTASVATLHQGCSTPRELLEHLCAELGLDVDASAGRGAMLKALRDYLVSEYAANRSVVVIVDEAHSLGADCFEQIRLVGNLDAEDAKLMQVLLLGQPSLQKTLRSAGLRQLRQRIFRSFNLGPLTPEQTTAYIRHRLRVAGAAREDVISDAAAELIYRFSGGLPRMINTACDNALLDAYATGRPVIDADFMQEVLNGLGLLYVGCGDSTEPSVSAVTRPIRDFRKSYRKRHEPVPNVFGIGSGAETYLSPMSEGHEPDDEPIRILSDLASRIGRVELHTERLCGIEARLRSLLPMTTDAVLTPPRRSMSSPPVGGAFRPDRRSLQHMASIVQDVVDQMRRLSKQIRNRRKAGSSSDDVSGRERSSVMSKAERPLHDVTAIHAASPSLATV